MKKWMILFVCFAFPSLAEVPKAGLKFDALNELAIQDRGRFKPFETFANETVQYVTGKRGWNGASASEVLISWLFTFDVEWEEQEFILVNYKPLKKAIDLEVNRKYFSMEELRTNEALRKIAREAMQKNREKIRLSEIEKKAENVQGQLGILQAAIQGSTLFLLPNPKGLKEDWFALSRLSDPSAGGLPYSTEQLKKLADTVEPLIRNYRAGNAEEWNRSLAAFVSFIKNDLGKDNYPNAFDLQIEVHFNHLRPFRWSWVLYALAFILLISYKVTQKKGLNYAGLGTMALAFGLNIYGFFLRSWISGRPPVTNMYESVLWVASGCVLFGGIIWIAYKKDVVLIASAGFAVVAFILADNLPLILDPSIQPLEPVLRSNFWLTIHVLTITLSYAAFALSLAIGNVVLGNYLYRPSGTSKIQELSLYMYRAIQIGVVLLAAGTILGGVWADYSWGRFWGWDPKEVWALIALLVYLAVLHGRFTGWLKGFGFVACTVVSFLGVLMAWYGVNFVLGAGLHSYGFGSGGYSYVISYIVLQLAFIFAAYYRFQQAKKTEKLDTSIFPKGTR